MVSWPNWPHSRAAFLLPCATLFLKPATSTQSHLTVKAKACYSHLKSGKQGHKGTKKLFLGPRGSLLQIRKLKFPLWTQWQDASLPGVTNCSSPVALELAGQAPCKLKETHHTITKWKQKTWFKTEIKSKWKTLKRKKKWKLVVKIFLSWFTESQ